MALQSLIFEYLAFGFGSSCEVSGVCIIDTARVVVWSRLDVSSDLVLCLQLTWGHHSLFSVQLIMTLLRPGRVQENSRDQGRYNSLPRLLDGSQPVVVA